jgi:hypothetical protein
MKSIFVAATLCAVVLIVTPMRGADVSKSPGEAPDGEMTQQQELASVQGKWKRTVKTDGGILTLVKEHVGNKTTLSILDPNDGILAVKSSEFRLELDGKVRVFTYFNNLFTAGPQAGQADKAFKSYIYRVHGDTFFEIHGMLKGDSGPPTVFTWQRVNE